MGFLRCFTRHAPSGAPALGAPAPVSTEPTSPPDRSTSSAGGQKVVRAPEGGPSGAATGFVPRTVAELHPEYAHSEPYHFAANTASARLVLDSAERAARRAGDLRVCAAVVPKERKVVVRGPTYSARPEPEAVEKTLTPEEPRPKSNVKLVVESPGNYPREGQDVQDENDNAASNPPTSSVLASSSRGLSRFIKGGKSPRGKSPRSSPMLKKSAERKRAESDLDNSAAVNAAIAHTRSLKDVGEQRVLNFDDAEVEDAPRPPSYQDGYDQAAARRTEQPSGYEDDNQWEEEGHPYAEEEEHPYAEEEEHPYAEEEEHPYVEEDEEKEASENEEEDQQEEYEQESYRYDEEEEESERSAEEESDAERSSAPDEEYYQQYPDAEPEEHEQSGSEAGSDGTDAAVSANGFLSEDPNASNGSVTASVRSSIRSSIRSSTRSAAMDNYSIDSDYVHSTDGDRVRATFGFMRDSMNTNTTVDEDMSEHGTPATRYDDRNEEQDASFASGSSAHHSSVREGSYLSDHAAAATGRQPAMVTSANNSFLSQSSQPDGSDHEQTDANSSFTRNPSASPRSGSVLKPRRVDSTLAGRKVEAYAAAVAASSPRGKYVQNSPRASPLSYARRSPAASPRRAPSASPAEENRYADYSDSEGGSMPSANLVPIRAMRAPAAKKNRQPPRKTVSFRVDKEVVIEPNLVDRRAPSSSVPRNVSYNPSASPKKLVSALKKQSSHVHDAEPMRQMPSAIAPRVSFSMDSNPSPGSSFASASRSANNSYDQIPNAEGYNPHPSPSRNSRRSIRVAPEELNRRRSQAVASAMAEQIRGVPRSAMLAYSEHEQPQESDEENAPAPVSYRGSLRPRARSARSIRLPPVILPGVVPQPPPPPPFAPEPTRVRSVRLPPPPPKVKSNRMYC